MEYITFMHSNEDTPSTNEEWERFFDLKYERAPKDVIDQAHGGKPVIGVPIDASLNGLDALLSTVQMPGGIPVATVAVGKAGAKNAAYLAAQILATKDAALAKRLIAERQAATEAVLAKDRALQEKLGNV